MEFLLFILLLRFPAISGFKRSPALFLYAFIRAQQ